MTRRRARRPLGVLALLLALTGCVGMPTQGPVRESGEDTTSTSGSGVTINPRRPGTDDTPDQIARGFLEAMTATPAITTSVAREFLTREAAAAWKPAETIVYAGLSAPRGTTDVVVDLDGAYRTDSRGAWLGPLSAAESTISFPMEMEGGQWRISAVPNALIVPEFWFEQRFRQASLYFFDPTTSVLVPDPVYVPRGPQLASALVNGLLSGPPSSDAAGQVTALPAVTASISVPVSDSGLAEIDLSGGGQTIAMPGPPEADLLVSQLAWTLRQDPSIARFRVTVDNRPLQLPDSETTFGVDHGQEFAPYVAGSSTQLFGLRAGLLVAGDPRSLKPADGPFGRSGYALRSVAVDPRAEQVAAVSAAGSEVLLAPLKDPLGSVTQVASGGADLLEPAWDFSGRVWLVDRRPEGSVVSYVEDGAVRSLDVPGISGADVKAFLVSRDGSRLVAVLRRGPDDDDVRTARIVTGADGRVLRALPAEDVKDPDEPVGTIRDIAWRSPTSVVVLHPVSRLLNQVRTITVDGAPSGPDAISITLDDQVTALLGTPVPGETPYALGGGVLTGLTGPRTDSIPVEDDVTTLGYAG